jgi:hypothetical protein
MEWHDHDLCEEVTLLVLQTSPENQTVLVISILALNQCQQHWPDAPQQ